MPDISLLELFGIFFYVGLFTIGGGLVAITLMQQMIVDRGLIDANLFYNMVAISESTPGPIGVNMVTYLGYNFYGIPGGIITTLGEILPSIICILIIARFMGSFQNKPIVKTIFTCLRPAATGLIFVATINIFVLTLFNLPESFFLIKNKETFVNIFNWPNITFYIIALLTIKKTNIHPIFLILAGALFGIIFL